MGYFFNFATCLLIFSSTLSFEQGDNGGGNSKSLKSLLSKKNGNDIGNTTYTKKIDKNSNKKLLADNKNQESVSENNRSLIKISTRNEGNDGGNTT